MCDINARVRSQHRTASTPSLGVRGPRHPACPPKGGALPAGLRFASIQAVKKWEATVLGITKMRKGWRIWGRASSDVWLGFMNKCGPGECRSERSAGDRLQRAWDLWGKVRVVGGRTGISISGEAVRSLCGERGGRKGIGQDEHRCPVDAPWRLVQ